jgi:uncharacterized 2Fe-2S/4Fe-4S cluster protein (DUF4445 family)
VENLDKSHEIRDFRLYFLDKDMENCIIRLEHNDAKRQEEEIYMNKTELVAAIAERAELSKEVENKIIYVGNSSKTGAYMTLLSEQVKEEMEGLAERMEYIELAETENYEKIFAESMRFV